VKKKAKDERQKAKEAGQCPTTRPAMAGHYENDPVRADSFVSQGDHRFHRSGAPGEQQACCEAYGDDA